MAVPGFQSFLLPLLRLMADGTEHSLSDLRPAMQAARALSEEDLQEKVPSGAQSKFVNRLPWASVYLAKAGALKRVRRGILQITDRGRELLRENPDGIKEDKLGLDNLYVQAKRWAGTVGRPVVQAFAGSLEGHRARKGVLITTSDFSPNARDYVQKIEKKIVLIHGKQMAELMIDHDVGVTTERTYTVKKSSTLISSRKRSKVSLRGLTDVSVYLKYGSGSGIAAPSFRGEDAA